VGARRKLQGKRERVPPPCTRSRGRGHRGAIRDVRRVWANCIAYNGPEKASAVSAAAARLRANFETDYARLVTRRRVAERALYRRLLGCRQGPQPAVGQAGPPAIEGGPAAALASAAVAVAVPATKTAAEAGRGLALDACAGAGAAAAVKAEDSDGSEGEQDPFGDFDFGESLDWSAQSPLPDMQRVADELGAMDFQQMPLASKLVALNWLVGEACDTGRSRQAFLDLQATQDFVKRVNWTVEKKQQDKRREKAERQRAARENAERERVLRIAKMLADRAAAEAGGPAAGAAGGGAGGDSAAGSPERAGTSTPNEGGEGGEGKEEDDEEEDGEAAEQQTEEYLAAVARVRDARLKTDPLGQDRSFDRYWCFGFNGEAAAADAAAAADDVSRVVWVEEWRTGRWVAYRTLECQQRLLDWLEPKGKRESVLAASLQKCVAWHRGVMAAAGAGAGILAGAGACAARQSQRRLQLAEQAWARGQLLASGGVGIGVLGGGVGGSGGALAPAPVPHVPHALCTGAGPGAATTTLALQLREALLQQEERMNVPPLVGEGWAARTVGWRQEAKAACGGGTDGGTDSAAVAALLLELEGALWAAQQPQAGQGGADPAAFQQDSMLLALDWPSARAHWRRAARRALTSGQLLLSARRFASTTGGAVDWYAVTHVALIPGVSRRLDGSPPAMARQEWLRLVPKADRGSAPQQGATVVYFRDGYCSMLQESRMLRRLALGDADAVAPTDASAIAAATPKGLARPMSRRAMALARRVRPCVCECEVVAMQYFAGNPAAAAATSAALQSGGGGVGGGGDDGDDDEEAEEQVPFALVRLRPLPADRRTLPRSGIKLGGTPRPGKQLGRLFARCAHKANFVEGVAPFLGPVNARDEPDYERIVRRPMDLGKLFERAQKGKYATQAEFETDVRLIGDNCKVRVFVCNV
jgi:hypothetical protein